jgi:hypothetical protein
MIKMLQAMVTAACFTFLMANPAVADSLWIIKWAPDPSGKIRLFDERGNEVGFKNPPELPSGGRPAQMTASGLWRMETDKGPIFFELGSVEVFNAGNQSPCDVSHGSDNRAGSSNGMAPSSCQH